MNKLTDNDLEMIATALRAMVEFWEGRPVDHFQAEQVASWKAMLAKVEALEEV